MPVQFLTDAERARLSGYPEEVGEEALAAYFLLTDDELGLVRRHRGDGNRLGFALQLCTLRFLGFIPDDLRAAPANVVMYLARQLGIPPSAAAEVHGYADRDQTRSDHQREVEAAIGFRLVDTGDLTQLGDWLLERALEHDKPTLLLQMATEHLRAARLVRPGITTLERLVSSARERAEHETFRRVEPLLTKERRAALDAILVPDAEINRTRLMWLRTVATAATPGTILVELDKLAFVRGLGADTWDLASLTPNRRKFLAQLARRATNQALQRTTEERRFPALLSFLSESVTQLTDEVVDLFDRTLAVSHSRAKRELDELKRTTAKTANAKVVLFEELSGLVLDDAIADAALRAAIFERFPRSQLEAARAEAKQVARPLDDNHFDFLGTRYSHVREFAPAFIAALKFGANAAGAELVRAVDVLRQLNAEQKRRVPDDAPLDFVSARWRPYVVDESGHIQRRFWELCLLSELRDALRSGDVWVAGSRRFANPETFLIGPDQWPKMRVEVSAMLGATLDGAARMATCENEFTTRLGRLDLVLAKGGAVRVEDGELVVGRLVAEEIPEETTRLAQLVAERLPKVELAELLIEVDRWCSFTAPMTHAAGGTTRSDDVKTLLYAAILAQACNFGLGTMAEISDLSYRRLAWVTEWHVREETLKAATNDVVNFHHRLPLAKVWGPGTLSSSDGQRFLVDVKSTTAVANPRYFGRGHGVTFYHWGSDQFSQFGTKVVPTTVRDATYVLDGLLDNETDLAIVEHTTDTAGYTDVVFALFDLLGLQFAPRIADIGGQKLYRVGSIDGFLHLAPLLRGTIQRQMILDRWEDLLRVAGSIKLGWVTASLLISRLQASPRQNALTKALQEYGRVVKTLFVLRYLESEEYRRRINAQLNKGESVHALRRFLFFADQGHVRRRNLDEQTNQASCLTLVTNAIITWNSVYMAAALDRLRAEGANVPDTAIAHLSPTLSAHVNPYGRYRFDVTPVADPTALRPLRAPEAAP